MKNKFKVLFLFVMLVTGIAYAADSAPMVLLKDISNRMIQELDKNIGHLSYNYVYGLANKIVVPHFDTYNMSRAVVGREYWAKAKPETQQAFVKEFTRYVIGTYASTIQSYDGERLKFYPMRGEAADQRVQINSDLLHKDGPPIQIQYRLVNTGKCWLIYDYSIDGVSVVQNYRSQFSEVLRQGGLEKLLQQLRKHNQEKR